MVFEWACFFEKPAGHSCLIVEKESPRYCPVDCRMPCDSFVAADLWAGGD